MLEALEIEIGDRLRDKTADKLRPEAIQPVLARLEDTLSNGLQITESKAYLAESFVAGLEELMRLYVDSPRRERSQRLRGRAALVAAMRMRFEEAGVWTLMRKQIAAADYTKRGDPLRIDCGYRFNGTVCMFQAVSLDTDADAVKVLAFSSPDLTAGVERVDNAKLNLTAIVEPIRELAGAEVDEDREVQYEYARETFKKYSIRMLTSSDLPRVAETARRQLGV
jgi:hypothetical protein